MTERQDDMTTQQLVKAVVESIQEKKGGNISILDLTSIDNTIASYFIVCDGSSSVHVDAIADSVEQYVKEHTTEKPFHIEGRRNAQWVLLDYLDVIVHVFQQPVREFYNLEELWADAQREDIPDLN
ncbi:MAG TPA: ribosome silencing factor [Marinilabiliaceae bacterium]|nr:ribosome silencing factor [Marinilabiliaceae bacterium]